MKKMCLLLLILTGPCFAGLSEGDKALKTGERSSDALPQDSTQGAVVTRKVKPARRIGS